jgi:pimeloyl-ACP methyl ester carboxylesterase
MLFLSPFLLTLGLMQLFSARLNLRGVSLTGGWHWLGYLLGMAMFFAGGYLLPNTLWILVTLLPASAVAFLCLLGIGSLLGRNLNPARFLSPGDWPEGRCEAVDIPNGERIIPGLLLTPPAPGGAAVCLAHGSGDTKTAFKWRLIGALLKRGLTVLTIDLAGHGQNQTPQRWPDCTTEIPAALEWLRARPNIERVGLLGISMGGTLSSHAAVVARPDALALLETPISFHFTKSMVWQEVWAVLHSPVLDLMREITPWGIWRVWNIQQGKRHISLEELIRRLDVPGQVTRLTCPLHLVYGQRDNIAPVDHGWQLHQVASVPRELTVIRGSSHVTLILIAETNRTLVDWFAAHLAPPSGQENVSI